MAKLRPLKWALPFATSALGKNRARQTPTREPAALIATLLLLYSHFALATRAMLSISGGYRHTLVTVVVPSANVVTTMFNPSWGVLAAMPCALM